MEEHFFLNFICIIVTLFRERCFSQKLLFERKPGPDVVVHQSVC